MIFPSNEIYFCTSGDTKKSHFPLTAITKVILSNYLLTNIRTKTDTSIKLGNGTIKNSNNSLLELVLLLILATLIV